MLPLMSLFTGEKAFPKAAVNKYKKNIFYKFMKLQFDNELKVFLLYLVSKSAQTIMFTFKETES